MRRLERADSVRVVSFRPYTGAPTSGRGRHLGVVDPVRRLNTMNDSGTVVPELFGETGPELERQDSPRQAPRPSCPFFPPRKVLDETFSNSGTIPVESFRVVPFPVHPDRLSRLSMSPEFFITNLRTDSVSLVILCEREDRVWFLGILYEEVQVGGSGTSPPQTV